MMASILQIMGLDKSKPVHSRASENSKLVHAQANSARRTDVKPKASSPKAAAKAPGKTSKAPAKSPPKVSPKLSPKAVKGKAAKKAAPQKLLKVSKTPKSVPRPLSKVTAKVKLKAVPIVVKKAGAKLVTKGKLPKAAAKVLPPLNKPPVKLVAKVVLKPAGKPATKPGAKAVVKAVVKPAAKVATKVAPKAAGRTTLPKSADKAVAKNVIEVLKRKSEPGGSVVSNAKAVTPVKSNAVAVTAAPPASPVALAPKAGRPSSRLAQLTVAGMAQSVASTAAKSSYSQTVALPLIVPSMTMAAKKDPKLANNWKTKPVEQLTDPELLSMPDAEYMNDKQMAVFRLKLSILKQDILNSASDTTEHLREDTVVVPDPADRATIEEEHALELRTRDRERKLLKKIEQSINRIDAGDYGYCDETGEPIGVGRLLARPTATLSLEAQQRRELKQKMFGD